MPKSSSATIDESIPIASKKPKNVMKLKKAQMVKKQLELNHLGKTTTPR
ncbi:MAG: hypothetical protein ACTSYM_11985 [Candidatus Baldrarchaeia archaeon]